MYEPYWNYENNKHKSKRLPEGWDNDKHANKTKTIVVNFFLFFFDKALKMCPANFNRLTVTALKTCLYSICFRACQPDNLITDMLYWLIFDAFINGIIV